MKGILFKPDMHQAIREDRKTITRRVMKPQPFNQTLIPLLVTSDTWGWFKDGRRDLSEGGLFKPRYQVGEVMYIKEAWYDHNGELYYKADWAEDQVDYVVPKWRSPLFMPAWASRDFIQITDVRVEKLNQISEDDALAEGVENMGQISAVVMYAHLWNSINSKNMWSSNPFVWVYTFIKVDKLVKE